MAGSAEVVATKDMAPFKPEGQTARDGVTDFLHGHANLAKAVGSTVVSITLERSSQAIGKSVLGEALGSLVEPAIWAVSDEAPDGVDVLLWAAGMMGGPIMVAATVAGLLKAAVDDVIDQKVRAIQIVEGEPYAKGIRHTSKYSFFSAGQQITAMTIAAHGGTTWEMDDIWVYLTDAKGRLVCDYEPKNARTIYRPLLPLRPVPDGYQWHSIRGGLPSRSELAGGEHDIYDRRARMRKKPTTTANLSRRA